jgi:uncharacterized protein (TIGR02996 family)
VTATEEKLGAWWKEIEQRPEDRELRRVFADWLEENGHNALAAGQRWQAAAMKRCEQASSRVFTWYQDWQGEHADEPTRLRRKLLNRMARLNAGRKEKAGSRKRWFLWIDHASVAEAETALATALVASPRLKLTRRPA